MSELASSGVPKLSTLLSHSPSNVELLVPHPRARLSNPELIEYPVALTAAYEGLVTAQ